MNSQNPGPKMMEVRVSEDETEAHIMIPGYAFGDLNRAGAYSNLIF